MVATFMTTLMMVGVVTLPLEIKYFGRNVAIVRNVLNFFAAIVIYVCFQIGTIMAVETAKVQSVIEDHIPMCTEGQMKCAWCLEIFIAFTRWGLYINMAHITSINKLNKIKY